jgi:hypothetical protein
LRQEHRRNAVRDTWEHRCLRFRAGHEVSFRARRPELELQPRDVDAQLVRKFSCGTRALFDLCRRGGRRRRRARCYDGINVARETFALFGVGAERSFELWHTQEVAGRWIRPELCVIRLPADLPECRI